MDFPAELRDFLTTRRARLSPDKAGVPTFHGTRRVPGLRREEVAHLAGVSVDYYTRLERGKVAGVSQEVLEAVARALQLDEDEREHLLHLVESIQPVRPAHPRRTAKRAAVRPELQRVLDSLTVPAFIQNNRLDFVAANHLGRAIYSLPQPGDGEPFNPLRYQFLDARAQEFYRDYELATTNGVALLRAAAGENPTDEGIIKLVGELSTQSESFRTLWAAHNVLRYRHGAKRYQHPIVGDLDFDYESLQVTDTPALTMIVYTLEPNSPTQQALQLLASWTTTTGPSLK
ncbi:helix-turn-helix transcriptional regulator [Micromonospora sp. NPDC023633]|uniref:helix-turn-helix transcriptional regulator n=1 Tax=Micromonospora sp. NPDC023633 TaxID=3154320 RepID=UPI0033C95E8A